MRVISFYTAGGESSYAEEVEILAGSLERFGIPHHIEEKDAWGDWFDHTAHKANFIQSMRMRYEGPLVWIDVDAIVHSDPTEYFEGLAAQNFDFGVHYFRGPGKGHDLSQVQRRGWRLLSGTTFWGDTAPARNLLDAWVNLNETLRSRGVREGGGQKNLWYLTTCLKGLKIKRLSGSYTFVFDKPFAYPHEFKGIPIECSICGNTEGHFMHQEPAEIPIIEHTIASRSHRPLKQDKPLKERRFSAGREGRIEELKAEGGTV